METNLLPCPFCGSESKLYGGGIMKDFFVCCTNEKCGIQQEMEMFFSTEEAIEAWNTRCMPPCETCPQMDNPDSFMFHLLQVERRANDAAE